MSETLESARRWSGYVCPDCRFVFRIPRDHDGRGIVCPSCRRMLKIPTSGDIPPPLLAPIRRAESEPPPPESDSGNVKKRRRGKRKEGEDHAWEHQQAKHRSGRGEKTQMRLLFISGTVLLLMVLGGVIYSMNSRKATMTVDPHSLPVTGGSKAVSLPETASKKSDAEFLSRAESLARSFLEAKTVDELVPLIRNAPAVVPHIKSLHPDGKLTPEGLSTFNVDKHPVPNENITEVKVVTRNQDSKILSFVDTPAGLKIDWESWNGWSEMSWGEFLKSKPTEAKVFRLILSPIEYYNFEFKEESKWQSYRLLSPDKEESIYGYVEKQSDLAKRLRPDKGTSEVKLTLSLKFPKEAHSNNQVLIESFITEGWVEKDKDRAK